MNTKTRNKLTKLIGDQRPPQEDEFTTYDYIKEYNELTEAKLTHSGAMHRLKTMLENGVVTVRKGKVGSRQTNIYKPV